VKSARHVDYLDYIHYTSSPIQHRPMPSNRPAKRPSPYSKQAKPN
jgi:hypothetical protein